MSDKLKTLLRGLERVHGEKKEPAKIPASMLTMDILNLAKTGMADVASQILRERVKKLPKNN